jgi:hypothetical protein
MNKHFLLHCSFLTALLAVLCINLAVAQTTSRPTRPGATGSEEILQTDKQGRIINSRKNAGPGTDSLQHRDNTEDSITISFRYYDSTRVRYFDSSINDFTTRFPLPAHYITLGNMGTAARSIIFNPNLRPGFDPGFHAYDIYRLRLSDTRFFQTTRPFTELGYMLGGEGEQMINVLHTQNVKPNFNIALQYRLINSPGSFQNQNTSHNSYRLNGNYQSRNKRYTVYGIYLVNKINASENGGIQRDTLLDDFRYTNRFVIPTRLSGDSTQRRNPFNTRIVTGNVYGEKVFLFRHQYDFGQSDSLIVNDTTVIRLFYPRFRFQHTFVSKTEDYEFRDLFAGVNKASDYLTYFGIVGGANDIVFHDKWQTVSNDLSIISFPEKNNLNQFIKAGAAFEIIKGTLDTVVKNYHNVFLTGEYRNRTRNQKWDLEAIGNFYVNGFNIGDYSVQAVLKRLISKKLGYLEVGFQNVNRSPSYIYTNKSAFPPVMQNDLSKENISRVSGSITNDAKNFALSGEYFVASNYTYFNGFASATQEATLFNALHLFGKKKFALKKWLTLYSEFHLQQTTPNAPVKLPLFFTNNRIVIEGIYHKNMNYATGFEVRYHTPYKADNYSPFFGQFFYQDNVSISNRPDVNFFFNFRIKRFSTYVRFENLNTLSDNTGSFGFNKNNLVAPHYPQQGLWIRIGIWWSFIN